METVKRLSGNRYREKIYIDGRAVTSPYFSRKSDAKTWKIRKQQEKERYLSTGVNPANDIAFCSYCSIFLSRKSDRKKRTRDSYKEIIENYLIPSIGSKALSKIRLKDAEDIKYFLSDKGRLSFTRINNILNVLKIILRDAVKTEYLLVSPVRNLEFLKVIKKDIEYWLEHEAIQFLQSVEDSAYYPFYLTALNTGLRLGELCGLHWDQIDFENRKILVSRSVNRYGLADTTKSGKSRIVPMPEPLFIELSKLRTNSSSVSYVFLNEKGKPVSYEHLTQRIFKPHLKKSGLRAIRLHDLRTTYGSNFVMNGGDIFVLSKILGHSSVKITEDHYAHLHSNYLSKQGNIVSFSATNSPNIALKLVDNEVR